METKIVQLTSAHEPSDVRIFYKECRSLARAGYAVTLVAPGSKDQRIDGVRIKAVPQSRGRLSRMTLTVWRVYREALRQKANVYHFHDPELIPVGLLLRALGKKVIYDIHEDVPNDMQDKHYVPKGLRRPLGWLIEPVENLASHWFSALVPATFAIGERFHRSNRNTVVLHNYPLLQELAPAAQVPWGQRPCSVIYLGTLAPERGMREIVQAMGLLPEWLRARLALCGSFTTPGLEDGLARQPGWKRVDALGSLSRAEVVELLGRARAGLVVSHPGPNHIRAEPNKLFEYMAAGIPVIASDFPLWRQIVGDAGCGLLVDPLNPHAIAQAIEYLLTHTEEAEAMGRCGRRAVENYYNWENEERKLLQLYADLGERVCAG